MARYEVSVECNHCGGEPADYPYDAFTNKRAAKKYAADARRHGFYAEACRVTDEGDLVDIDT